MFVGSEREIQDEAYVFSGCGATRKNGAFVIVEGG